MTTKAKREEITSLYNKKHIVEAESTANLRALIAKEISTEEYNEKRKQLDKEMGEIIAKLRELK